jgi:hypothetical protein
MLLGTVNSQSEIISAQSLALSQMQETVAQLQEQQTNNQTTSSSTGYTETGAIIINNYYTISSGSTES